MSLQKLVDMRRSPEEKMDAMSPMSFNMSDYPCGLSISLTQDELEKLEVDHADCDVGDVYDLRALCKVTCKSENENDGGKTSRIEMQIVMLGVESESDEVEPRKSVSKKLYKKD